MVPFDDQPPMISSGIRVGTPAITTRGLKEQEVKTVVDLMDRVITNSENDAIIAEVKKEVIDLMSGRPLFAQ
jgi:glycine hydroxymethyltransferase